MPPVIVKIIGLMAIAVALWGLVSGAVVAGSRGFRAHFYRKQENPFAFYLFVCIYGVIGLFLLTVQQ